MTHTELRNNLNAIFMLTALIGVILYFALPEYHIIGLVVIGAGMLVKIAEFFIRFML